MPSRGPRSVMASRRRLAAQESSGSVQLEDDQAALLLAASTRQPSPLKESLGESTARLKSGDADLALLVRAVRVKGCGAVGISTDAAVGLSADSAETDDMFRHESLAFLSDLTCLRYLRARNWELPKAVALLIETLRWRQETIPTAATDPQGLLCSMCIQDPFSHCFFQLGWCKERRPVIYTNAGRFSSFEVPELTNHLIVILERTFQLAPEDAGAQWIWMLDLNGFRLKHANRSLARQLTEVFSKHYCERLGMVICLNASVAFISFWNMVRLLLQKNTAEKVKVIRNAEAALLFQELFDDATLVHWLNEVVEMTPTPGNIPPLPACTPDVHNLRSTIRDNDV